MLEIRNRVQRQEKEGVRENDSANKRDKEKNSDIKRKKKILHLNKHTYDNFYIIQLSLNAPFSIWHYI